RGTVRKVLRRKDATTGDDQGQRVGAGGHQAGRRILLHRIGAGRDVREQVDAIDVGGGEALGHATAEEIQVDPHTGQTWFVRILDAIAVEVFVDLTADAVRLDSGRQDGLNQRRRRADGEAAAAA